MFSLCSSDVKFTSLFTFYITFVDVIKIQNSVLQKYVNKLVFYRTNEINVILIYEQCFTTYPTVVGGYINTMKTTFDLTFNFV